MTTTTTQTTELLTVSEPLFSADQRTALAGYLAGYSGLTRDAYTLDLRMFTTWCQAHELHLFQARRADIECFGRDIESRGRARATIARRLCTISGFYRYAVEEELLEHSPAVHVRRPRLATNPTPSAWTATKSARCWSQPDSVRRTSTH